MLNVPVVLVAFNRPGLTSRVLEGIRAAQPKQLFLIADGPRGTHPTDDARCRAVREILQSIDWPCDVRRRYSTENRGCETTVELGLDWVFSQVEEAIVLEDDCLAGPSFFDFCAAMLDRYRDTEAVSYISGTTHFVPASLFGTDSYAFGYFAGVWGWATWGRAWRAHRAVFPRQHGSASVDAPAGCRPCRTEIVTVAPTHLLTNAGRRYFAGVAHSTRLEEFGWDSHWYLTTASMGRFAITPAVNLVENIGFTEDATHTRSTRRMPAAAPITWPLNHPPEVALNPAVQRELELVLARGNGRLARRLRRIVPPGPLRTVARTVATGRLTARLIHLASRSAGSMRRLGVGDHS